MNLSIYLSIYFLVTGDCKCVLTVQGHLRSWTFAQINNALYDFLLVNNEPNSYLARFSRDSAAKSQTQTKHSTRVSVADQGDRVRIFSSYLPCKKPKHYATVQIKPRDHSFHRFVTIHSRHRQTTYNNIWTLKCNCNVRLKYKNHECTF